MIEPLRTAVLNAKCAENLDADSDDEVFINGRFFYVKDLIVVFVFSFVSRQNRTQLVNNRKLLANII
jgi:hypothetical protein